MSNPYTPPDTTALAEGTPGVRPRPFVALLLSVVAFGGGYYYAGARWRLVGLAMLFPCLLAGIAISTWAGLPPWTFGALLLVNLLVWIDAFRQARRPDARRPPWPELAGALVLCIAYFNGLSLLFRAFVLEPYHIPSAAMTPTLEVGDYVLVDKIAYLGGEPQRGDIAVFRFPDDPSVDFVKRIIGIPGDVVVITPEGEVEINGAPLPLTRAGSYRDRERGSDLSVLREETGPERSHLILRVPRSGFYVQGQRFEVPADAYFVLGDNRDNSKDSRRWQHTYVPRDHMLGKATYRHFSRDPESLWPRLERIGSLEERVDLPAETATPAGS